MSEELFWAPDVNIFGDLIEIESNIIALLWKNVMKRTHDKEINYYRNEKN